ncbi:MAG: hypothetical protein JSU72_05870 [Deltaproteobacteria bacterium]|nr:MAG: hypothetical protein JSU72_05870 [Deltaproteobacteria bacterium]
MSVYNQQQIETFRMVRHHLERLPIFQLNWLKRRIESYVQFRADVARFQREHFTDICSRKCFASQSSACCGREGIMTFFADVVVNVLISAPREIDPLLAALALDTGGFNCVYLGNTGCLWLLKPIVCEMFLCEHAKKSALEEDEPLLSQWEGLRLRERQYTWPSQRVLFDELEGFFLEAGLDSPLMYFHQSPGLLRVKAKHGLGPQKVAGVWNQTR